VKIKWLNTPEDHDYASAASYLSLLFDEPSVLTLTDNLKKAPMSQFQAKDIFRSSGLSLLNKSNSHVDSDRNKIKIGIKLSPLLLVRDSINRKLIIADGYHRLCAVYSFYENAIIPCKIV